MTAWKSTTTRRTIVSAYEVLDRARLHAAALEKHAQERGASCSRKGCAAEAGEAARRRRRPPRKSAAQKLEDEERRRAQKLEDEERRRAQKLEDEARRKAEREKEKKEAEEKRKAERIRSKIETQLISAGGQMLKRGLLGILKK